MKLSKSKVQLYEDCPYKFKKRYIDEEKEPPTGWEVYALKGTEVHELIEKFYRNVRVIKNGVGLKFYCDPRISQNPLLQNFIKLKQTIASSTNDPKHFYPFLQEKKIEYPQMNINGIVDAVYLNYEDDEYIVLDWKSGRMKTKTSMREELAFYKILVDNSELLDKPVRYWGMYFTGTGKMFMEPFKQKVVDEVKSKIINIRSEIQNNRFPKCRGRHCEFCGFKNRCWSEEGWR